MNLHSVNHHSINYLPLKNNSPWTLETGLLGGQTELVHMLCGPLAETSVLGES